MEDEGEPGGDDQLDDQGHDQDQPKHAEHVGRVERAAFGMGDQPGAQAQPPPGEHAEQGGAGHDPEPADLEQGEDRDEAEGRPVGRRVDGGQAGHADRRGRGEQGGEQRRAAGPGPRHRQHQQRRPDRDRDQEGGRDQPRRMPYSPLAHASPRMVSPPQAMPRRRPGKLGPSRLGGCP